MLIWSLLHPFQINASLRLRYHLAPTSQTTLPYPRLQLYLLCFYCMSQCEASERQ